MTDAAIEALRAEVVALTAEIKALRESWRCAKAKPERAGVASRAPAAYSPAFEAFWSAYACARRRNKPEAARWWRWAESLSEPEAIMAALESFKRTEQWRDGYMPEPARWLKSEPWLDEPTLPPAELHPVDPWAVKRGEA